LKPTPPPAQEPTSIQTNDNAASQEPVAKLSKALEGLDVEEECNDAQDMALDEFLVNALKNRQERLFLLKLDREFCSFINNPRYALYCDLSLFRTLGTAIERMAQECHMCGKMAC
jgi:hypothetical protein